MISIELPTLMRACSGARGRAVHALDPLADRDAAVHFADLRIRQLDLAARGPPDIGGAERKSDLLASVGTDKHSDDHRSGPVGTVVSGRIAEFDHRPRTHARVEQRNLRLKHAISAVPAHTQGAGLI